MTKEKITKSIAQRKLVTVWLIMGLLTAVMFVIVCWERTSDSEFTDAIQWLFNYIGPGMTLIIGSYAYAALQSDSNKKINRGFLRVTLWFTVVYIMIILTLVLLAPLAINRDTFMMDYLKKFNVILSFLETSLLVFLGIFFAKENNDEQEIIARNED